ncbi:MAG: hypothetical protein AAB971_01680 [Patescibacteria group bacterium]
MNSDPTSDQMQLDAASSEQYGQTGQYGFQPDAAVATMGAPGQEGRGFVARAYDRVIDTVLDAAASVAESANSRKLTAGVTIAAVALPAVGAAAAPRTSHEPASTRGNAIAVIAGPRKFKPCKDGKPKFQMRLLGPREITETETPVDYKLQAKSCKKRKGVEIGQNGWDHSQDSSSTTNMRARTVKGFDFQLIFPKSTLTDPNARDGLRITISASQGRKGLYGEMINFRYAASSNSNEATGSTGSTGATSGL